MANYHNGHCCSQKCLSGKFTLPDNQSGEKWSEIEFTVHPLVLLCLTLCSLWSTCIHSNPRGRALYKMKGSRETGNICFDDFTLHKRMWQPLNVSTHNTPGHLSASGHFTFPSLLQHCDISKSLRNPKPERICYISVPSLKIRFSEPFVFDLIFESLF